MNVEGGGGGLGGGCGGGVGGDAISSYNIGGHGFVIFLTNIEISIVQVGVSLRLSFEPTITYAALREITGGTDRLGGPR